MDIQIPEFDPSNVKFKIDPPVQTFFFKREDGSCFPVHEREAWTLYKTGHKIMGVSDGTKFQQALIEAKELYKTTGDFKVCQDRVRLGEKEELESALGNIKIPRNFDRLDSTGNPTNIMQEKII